MDFEPEAFHRKVNTINTSDIARLRCKIINNVVTYTWNQVNKKKTNKHVQCFSEKTRNTNECASNRIKRTFEKKQSDILVTAIPIRRA